MVKFLQFLLNFNTGTKFNFQRDFVLAVLVMILVILLTYN